MAMKAISFLTTCTARSLQSSNIWERQYIHTTEKKKLIKFRKRLLSFSSESSGLQFAT
jgi:hypothetical protein